MPERYRLAFVRETLDAKRRVARSSRRFGSELWQRSAKFQRSGHRHDYGCCPQSSSAPNGCNVDRNPVQLDLTCTTEPDSYQRNLQLQLWPIELELGHLDWHSNRRGDVGG